MKIQRYGFGGVYTPGTVAPSGVGASPGQQSAGSGKASTPFKDSIVNMLKDNALPNDHRGTLEMVMNVLNKYDEYPGVDISSGEYVALLNAISEGKTNQDVWKKASDYIYSNDTAEEAALDQYGRMYIGKTDENGQMQIDRVDPSQYAERLQEGWNAISNAGLLTMRANDDNLRWDMDIISGVNASTNSSKIAKKIQDAVTALPDTQTGYTMQRNGQLQSIIDGANIVMNDGGEYDSYHTRTDRPQDVEAFYQYVWDYVLNDGDKAYMRAKVARTGGDVSNPEQLLSVITQGLTLYTHYDKDETHKELKPTKVGSAGGGGGTSSGSLMATTLNEGYTTGVNMGIPTEFAIAPKGSQVRLMIKGQNVGPAVDAKSDIEARTPITKASLDFLMANAYGIGKDIAASHSISFGGHVLKDDELGGIMYNGSVMYRTKLPFIKDENGAIVPDFGVIEKAEKLKNAIENGQITPDMVNKYLPGAYYNEGTNEIEFPPSQTQLFLTFEGIAGTKFVDGLTNDPFLVRADDNGREGIGIYHDVIERGSMKSKKKEAEANGHIAPDGSFFTRDRLYRGNVFIPLDITAGSAQSNPGLVTKDSHTNLTARAMEMQRQDEVDFVQNRSFSWD